MTSARFGFTKQSLEKFVSKHEGERITARDDKTPGLILELREGGAATFFLYKRMGGRPTRYKLGRFPEVTVEQAKREATKKNGQIASGIDPAEERRSVRATMTLGALWEFYLATHAKPHKKSWATDEWLWRKFLKPWESRRIDQIRRIDFQALHVRLGKRSITNANRTRSLLLTMYNVAADGGYEGVNPALGVKPFREVKRDRYLTPDELGRLFTALDNDANQVLADAVRFGLWTGARRGNWLSARWDEIDLDRRVWTIPANKAKASRPIVIPLTAQAMDVLKSRVVASDWVFPSRYEGGDKHSTTAKALWQRVRDAAGIPDVRMHDLRRTIATFAVAAGVPLFQVAKLLGHKNSVVTESVYAIAQDEHLRAAIETAAGALAAAVAGKGGRNG